MLLLSQINDFYEQLYKELDIPESYYEKANISYTSFNSWLGRENSTLREYEPEIYLQGSFKLGTVIKPIGENDSYDIDMVCKLNKLSKQMISQKELKLLIGKEVESYANSKNMNDEPKDGNRCWTLNYHDEAKFHMDILPCIDDSKKFIEQLELYKCLEEITYRERAVAITDKRSEVYETISNDWEISNPEGYYLWFQERSNFIEKRAILAEQFQMKAEELKEYKVKTPLQKTIQILKRHRDIMFENNPNQKPSSIIISTLAAKAYNGGDNLMYVLKFVLDNMVNYIEVIDGDFRVLNPVNPLENFADKWNENQALKNHFDNWIKEAKKNLTFYNESIEIYGDDFQNNIFEQMGISKTKSKDLVEDDKVMKKIDSIAHRQKSKWNVCSLVDVHIKATKTKSGFSFPKQFNSGGFLTKNVDLKFEAKAQNIKQYDVYWQVTNTGNEATNDSCLRGDFYNGQIIEGKKIRKESTAYVGTHIVECYLVKNGVCYGKSEPFIVNIKDGFSMEW